MWIWILTIAIVTGLAAVLGFSSLAATSTVVAKTLFLICLAIFLALVVRGISRHA